MKITDLFSTDRLNQHISDGFVRMQHHPTEDLVILNYTEKAQFARQWDEVTRNCRGLIANMRTSEIVARPFPKFFNYGELTDLDKVKMTGPIRVTEKMDGSLGILYTRPSDGEIAVATRGSFTSDQAVWATNYLRRNAPSEWQDILLAELPWSTWLTEIIYPENRIVVDYEGEQMLVLLDVLDTATGDVVDNAFPWFDQEVEHHDFRSFLDVLAAPDRRNREGYVVYFWNTNARVKVKHEEYVALHKLVTGINERVIWEYMRDKVDYSKVYEIVPDEVYGWVEEVVGRLQEQFTYLQAEVNVAFDEIEPFAHDRKAFAKLALMTPYAHALFRLLDGKDIDAWLWDQIKPEAVKPWVNVYEEVSA